MRAVTGALVSQGVLRPITPLGPQIKPTEPTGFPAPGEGRPLPGAVPERRQETFILRRAERTSRTGQTITATGDVRFSFRGYDVTADEAQGDLGSQKFVLTGNVLLIGKDATVRGERVSVDFREGTFAFLTGRAQFGPARFQPPDSRSGVNRNLLRGDIYIRAVGGSGNANLLEGENGSFTTCNLLQPHYELEARSLLIRPYRRAILRDVRFKLFGRTLLNLPVIAIPLERYAERYTPEVGRSPDEGYYIKTRYTVPIRGADTVSSRLDYYTKLGVGIGGDYNYDHPNVRGQLSLFGVTGQRRTLTGSIQHQQRLLTGILSVDGSYQRNNYLTAPSATLQSLRLGYGLPDLFGGATRLGCTRSGSESGGFSTLQQSVSVSDERAIGRYASSLDLSFNSDRSLFSDGAPVRREQVDVRYRGEQNLGRGSAMLEYQRSIPVGALENFFSASDRTPLLTFRTDAGRLLGESFGRRYPFQTFVSWGELLDGITRRQVSRTMFDFNTGGRGRRGRSTLSYFSRFNQALYSNDTAQYVLEDRLSYDYRLAERSSLRVRYDYLRPYGFSPLSVDRTGQTNLVSFDANLRPSRTLEVSAQSSYDILRLKEKRVAWQTVGLRTEYRPSADFLLRTQSTYDPGRAVWSNQRLDIGARLGEGFLSAGTRYDGDRHTFGNVNLYAEGLRWGRLKASVLLNYNGYIRRFEARHFSFTYDLHCAEAILQIIDNSVGFRSGTEIVFMIRLKALPFDTPFGVNRRGGAIGTGTGVGF